MASALGRGPTKGQIVRCGAAKGGAPLQAAGLCRGELPVQLRAERLQMGQVLFVILRQKCKGLFRQTEGGADAVAMSGTRGDIAAPAQSRFKSALPLWPVKR